MMLDATTDYQTALATAQAAYSATQATEDGTWQSAFQSAQDTLNSQLGGITTDENAFDLSQQQDITNTIDSATTTEQGAQSTADQQASSNDQAADGLAQQQIQDAQGTQGSQDASAQSQYDGVAGPAATQLSVTETTDQNTFDSTMATDQTQHDSTVPSPVDTMFPCIVYLGTCSTIPTTGDKSMSCESLSDGGRSRTGDSTTAPCELLRLDEIDGADTHWLWPDRLPVGHVTVVAGEAGSGKSLLAADLAARVSSGTAWPEAVAGDTLPGPVLIAQSDRHLNPVVKRRLLAAGADPRRLALINADGEPPAPETQAGRLHHNGVTPAEALIGKLESALDQIADCRLVVVDHLRGWLRTPGPRAEELAALFDKLSELAARRRIALVIVWQLEKGGRGGANRALDAMLAAAPMVWLLGRDPYRSDSRVVVCAQNQLGRPADNLAFQMAGDRLVWQAATCQVTADEVVAASVRSVDRHERRQAGQWLLELLSEGPIEAQRLWEEARQCHLSERTVRRAAAEMGLHPTKAGQGGPWLWGFRGQIGDVRPACADSAPQTVAAFETVGSLPNSAAAEVEPRRDAPPSVAALETVGSLPNSAVVAVELRRDAPPSVAALETVGSLPNSQTAPQTASRSSKRRLRKLRRERKALEAVQAVLPNG
ncbi:MAG TPA: AAA family ATPase [Pirellulales bacterium]|nr:AAA family ATPase [Pirellulales bacterium]